MWLLWKENSFCIRHLSQECNEEWPTTVKDMYKKGFTKRFTRPMRSLNVLWNMCGLVVFQSRPPFVHGSRTFLEISTLDFSVFLHVDWKFIFSKSDRVHFFRKFFCHICLGTKLILYIRLCFHKWNKLFSPLKWAFRKQTNSVFFKWVCEVEPTGIDFSKESPYKPF